MGYLKADILTALAVVNAASAATLARETQCTEAEALEMLGWHEERGNVRRESKTWVCTSDGREWLADRAPKSGPRTAAPKPKRKPEPASVVQRRLREAGLWKRCEEFAKAHGVTGLALAGPRRSKYLASVRQAWYLELLNDPTQKRSSVEVAHLCGREHSTVLYGIARLREEKSAA